MNAATRIIGLRFALKVLGATATPLAHVSKLRLAVRRRSTRSAVAGVTFHIMICGFISALAVHLALSEFVFDGRTATSRNYPEWTETSSSRSKRSDCERSLPLVRGRLTLGARAAFCPKRLSADRRD